MTASTKPKTPSMTIAVNGGASSTDIGKFCKKASRLTISQVADNVVVKERLVVKGAHRSKEFTIDISFFPPEEYRSEYDVDSPEICAAFAARFPGILRKEIQAELKRLDADLRTQIAALGKGKVVRETADMGGEEGGEEVDDEAAVPRRGDDASELGDGDAEDAKRAKQRKEQATYESDDEDAESDGAANKDDENADEDDEGGTMDTQEAKNKSEFKVENLFLENCPFATSFNFNPKGCKIELSVSCIRCVVEVL
jgi:DNA-directed RNA polymerase I subunit RPA1